MVIPLLLISYTWLNKIGYTFDINTILDLRDDMQYSSRKISRREFLKLLALGVVGVNFRPWSRLMPQFEFPKAEYLGRVTEGMVEVKTQPDYDSPTVKVLYEDSVVPWVKEVIGRWPWRNNQRWVETPEGYIWAPYLQPVKYTPNQPVEQLPKTGDVEGMWVEVTIPFVDAVLDNPPPRSRWLEYRMEHGLPPRLYYSQILWVDQLKQDDQGNIWYRINERYGNPGDIFWARGEAFRPITKEEVAPIHPNVEDKKVIVDVNYRVQTLSCYEGEREVYFCRISSGKLEGSTPVTPYGAPGFPIWRKLYSVHMAGGTNADGWDLPGIGWTSLFVGEGVAIHSTFWHNNFGEPMSHGCVNAKPEDAKWIFRWVQPAVPFESGDITISGSGSTRIIVRQS